MRCHSVGSSIPSGDETGHSVIRKMQYRRIPMSGPTLVVAFDICSSSNVTEELTLNGGMNRLARFLTELKRYLAREQKRLPFDPYKFTGDGWILLFPASTNGSALLRF